MPPAPPVADICIVGVTRRAAVIGLSMGRDVPAMGRCASGIGIREMGVRAARAVVARRGWLGRRGGVWGCEVTASCYFA